MSAKEQIETQLVPYDLDAAKVEELKAKYLDVTIKPDDKAAYAMVMAGQRECREIRLACEEWHKDRKAWINKAARHYDGERRRVLGLLSPIEDHLKEVRKAEDDRKLAIEAEKARKEAERVASIQVRIEAMKDILRETIWKTSTELRKIMGYYLDMDLTSEVFQEFLPEAEAAREKVVSGLMESIGIHEKQEKEEAERKAEAERLEKIRQEQAAEAARLAAEKAEMEAKAKAEQEARDAAKRAEDARIAAERKKIDDERAALEREKKAEQDRRDREALEKRLAEEAKAKAEKEAADKIEREAREKKGREEKEAAEKARLEALRPDKERLLVWAAYLDTIEGPEVKSDDAAQIVSDAEKCIGKAAALIRKAVKEMK